MAEEGTTVGTESTEGQLAEGTATQTTQTGTEGAEGQPKDGESGTTESGTQQTQTEETFFDPQDLEGKPELQAAYKSMQRTFSKKMENIKGDRQKIEAYNAFMSDPVSQLQAMSKQYGYKLSKADAQTIVNQDEQKFDPQSWEDVFSVAEKRAYDKVLKDLRPMLGEVQQMKKTNLEGYLDNNVPDWRQYEDEMMDTLREHPTLVKDPIKLYKLSLPPEVLESRATQKALKKLQEKAESSQIGGKSTTTKKAPTGYPDKAMSFDDAVKFAQQKMAEEGIRPPGA